MKFGHSKAYWIGVIELFEAPEHGRILGVITEKQKEISGALGFPVLNSGTRMQAATEKPIEASRKA